MTEVSYYSPKYSRLLPRTAWRGGMLADTDVVTLTDAARFASKHAGAEVTPADFLRAAGNGLIQLCAIVHQRARVQAFDGGIFCNAGQANENVVPTGSIPTLPLTACQHLAAAGRASWRTFDGVEIFDGERRLFTKGTLMPGEPDFETVSADCRVTGINVHALADWFADLEPEEPQATRPEPVVKEAAAERRTRWLDMFEAEKKREKRGALQRVADREGVDRSNMSKDIAKARTARDEQRRAGGWTSQLVQDGKRLG